MLCRDEPDKRKRVTEATRATEIVRGRWQRLIHSRAERWQEMHSFLLEIEGAILLAVMEEERSQGRLPRLGSEWPGGPARERKLQVKAEGRESTKSASHLPASCSCLSKPARHEPQVSLRDHDTTTASSKVSRSRLRLT